MSTWATAEHLTGLLTTWLPTRRWFPAKDAARLTIDALQVADLGTDNDVALVLVRVVTAQGVHVLQVPLVRVAAARDEDEVVGELAGAVLVDGAAHPRFLAQWLAYAKTAGTWLAHPSGTDPVAALGEGLANARPLTGEQSNTSVLVPATRGPVILKLFRVLAAGANPDVEIPVALAVAGWERVPRPVAWVALPSPADGFLGAVGTTVHSGVATQFIAGAADGFTHMAQLLGTNAVDRAEELAAQLGQTTAQLHVALRELGQSAPDTPAALAAHLRARAAWATAAAPVLSPFQDCIETVIDGVVSLPQLPPAQRIHGDYHLGQCLVSPTGWYILDFEGEPLRPLHERTLPDQAIRDVAGMLRSFDYAAAIGKAPDRQGAQVARDAFLTAYSTQTVGPPLPSTLLTAFELDKALYEVVYETRNRPGWVDIPLTGVQRLLREIGNC